MNDILRTFRLGVINLLGVTIPGLILILLLLFGFFFPGILLLQDIAARMSPLPSTRTSSALAVSTNLPHVQIAASSNANSTHETEELPTANFLVNVPPIGRIPAAAVLAIILILAYVIGYVFRLSTPDELDEKSARIVLAKINAEEDHWPYRGEKGNKFPYFHFKEYLEHRKHEKLASYVKWDEKNRSKTFVNLMKFETSLRCPHLSATIESNEAHIRMLFGTWQACRVCRWFVFAGAGASLSGCVLSVADPKVLISGASPLFPYILWTLVSLVLLYAAVRCKERIESLFHYRRVREIFDIVACYHLACQGFDEAGQPNIPRKENR